MSLQPISRPPPAVEGSRPAARSSSVSPTRVRQVRLAAAFVLLAYLITHFSNHALGLISLRAMEAGRHWFMLVWRSPAGTVALYGAIIIHAVLALWLLYQRRSLRMPWWELLQYVAGLALPALLAGHVTFARINWWQYGNEGSYAMKLLGYSVLEPTDGVRHAGVLLLAWTHACIGLHYWLRFRPWYARARTGLFVAAPLLPLLALGGFIAGSREVVVQARNPGWVEAQLARKPFSAVKTATLVRTAGRFVDGYLLAIVGVFVARGVRSFRARRCAVRIAYPDGQVVPVAIGSTILDASRQAGLPHASVCGGRGRCSTCRVLILDGLASLPPASDAERQVLASVHAAPDVRLACQTRPGCGVRVMPLLPATVAPSEALASDSRQGQEQRVAVLFADLRGFTHLAEKKLPYDTVFFLNRYFEAVGRAITGAGGVTNQFTGDGVMALFGLDEGPEIGCRQALAAVRLIGQNLARLSGDLVDDLPAPLRVGIGVHVGPAVIGQMGWRETFYLTAVGDTVHVAARLEQATKDFDAELIVSEDVAECAGADLSAFPCRELCVRNRAGAIRVRVVPRVANLASGGTAPPFVTAPAATSAPPAAR